MKIVCLIGSNAQLNYFVNRINDKHKVSLAVVEHSSNKQRFISKLARDGVFATLDAVLARLGDKLEKSAQVRDYNENFGDRWKSIEGEIPVIHVSDINSNEVLERLKKEKPDIILDHGTSIVKAHIIGTAPRSLNLHWGLSPYYRGSHCTEWALMNWDPYNIGVTIHTLTNVIDGGSVVAQARANVTPQDTVHSINMQLTRLGTEEVIKALDILSKGNELNYHPQDYSLGYVTMVRQWNKYARKQVKYIIRQGLIGTMLSKPARKEKLPIIEL